MKTWKKIEETKRRANDVVKAKLQNEERAQRKQMQLIEDQRRQAMQREQLAAMRAKRNAEKSNVKDAIFLHKKEEAKQAKFIDQQNKARFTVQLE